MMQANIADIRQRWANAKLKKMTVFWVAIGAIILTLFLGFSRGGWMTDGSAQRIAKSTSQKAVVERLAPICVVQFNQDPQKDQKFGDMKELNSSYRRTRYIKEQGWATMPGEEKPDEKVAAGCERLLFE